jgi:tetratricopeptide (TPR) repeat protein
MKLAVTGLLLIFVCNIHAQHGRRINPDENQIPVIVHGVDFSNPVRLFPPAPEPAPPSALKPVSVNELRIPAKAAKEFERSQKALQAGDIRVSAAHLEKAAEIYPKFLQAHDALGMRYLQLGEYEKALAEYQTALAIDPRNAHAYQNLGFTLLLLRSYPESEAAARRSLELDPHQVATQYVLGRAIIAQQHVTPEATQMLLLSEDAFPNASLVLALILFRQGHADQAVTELRHYLKSPMNDGNRQKAECWLANLTNSGAPSNCSGIPIPPNFN